MNFNMLQNVHKFLDSLIYMKENNLLYYLNPKSTAKITS